ncbi:MAG TPA: hypothetical protein VNI54_00340 [Thermoanaerobaculia bacterium]|nr:hypothetical protein [Thermoanaerobaculia bacterium]
MKRLPFIIIVLILGAACASTRPIVPLRDLLGVTVDMSRDEVQTALSAVGEKQRDERKRQEVWTLRDDASYEGAIVGYTPEWKVRFITLVARADGKPVQFADVLDVAQATHKSAGSTHTYRWHPAGASYDIVATGTDRVQYLTLTNEN